MGSQKSQEAIFARAVGAPEGRGSGWAEGNSSDLLESLKKYFHELKPQKKIEGEWTEFEILKQDYQVEQIADCLELLITRGTAPVGEAYRSYHSRLAYLAKAMPQVLKDACELKLKALAQLERDQRESVAAEIQNSLAEAEERAVLEREAAFFRAFPTLSEQELAIQKFMPALWLGILLFWLGGGRGWTNEFNAKCSV